MNNYSFPRQAGSQGHQDSDLLINDNKWIDKYDNALFWTWRDCKCIILQENII